MKKKTQTLTFKRIKSTPIGRTLRALRDAYRTQNEPEFLVIPYVLTCAAYLEAKLNDALSEMDKHYGTELSAALLTLSLPKKLLCIVPTLTRGVYEINKSNVVYQRLASLIRVRNEIAHAKSEFETIDFDASDTVTIPTSGGGLATVPKELFTSYADDITLGAAKTFTPTEYHDALDKLEKWFFHRCPDRLQKIDMVTRREVSKT